MATVGGKKGNMPHINDLSMNNIFEGNNGEKWQVSEGVDEGGSIWRKLIRLEVEETIVPINTKE